ncbi:MAG: inorganic diphosphatase [Pirellulaceae bacterium]
MKNPESYIGKKVEVLIDRPLGSSHPTHKFTYKVNYGYVSNTISSDGEELDVYFLGTDKPLNRAEGVCIAVVHRINDEDDKLVVVPEGKNFPDEEIEELIEFQEKWFKHKIIR